MTKGDCLGKQGLPFFVVKIAPPFSENRETLQ